MRSEEYRKHDAVSLAGLIAKRQVSAKEVLEVAIGRAEQVNPAINAIVHKHLCTLEEMEQAIRRGSRGRKPTKAVTFDEAEEPAERQRRKTANQ